VTTAKERGGKKGGGYPYEFSVSICDSILYRVTQKSLDMVFVFLHIERQVTGATVHICGLKSVY